MTRTPMKMQLHCQLHLEDKRLLISVRRRGINIYAAFYITKGELPFTKYKRQLDLQRKNGLKLNLTYNNF